MIFEVFHAIHPTFSEEVKLPIEDHYNKVADVLCNDLNDVYRITNHIDQSWHLNEGVQNAVIPARSTSVGDLVKTSDGSIFLCAHLGWSKINVELINK